MKRGKAKLLSEADIKNCLRYIDAMPNGERNRATVFYFSRSKTRGIKRRYRFI